MKSFISFCLVLACAFAATEATSNDVDQSCLDKNKFWLVVEYLWNRFETYTEFAQDLTEDEQSLLFEIIEIRDGHIKSEVSAATAKQFLLAHSSQINELAGKIYLLDKMNNKIRKVEMDKKILIEGH